MRVSKSTFAAEFYAFAEGEAERPLPRDPVLFYGSSSMRLWSTLAEDFPGVTLVNRGFGGSYTADLIKYADRILIPLKPRVIALQPGSNDLVNGKTPEQVLADFDVFVKKVRAALHEVKIVYLGINLSPKRWDIRDAQQRTNQLIEEHCKAGQNLAFVDLWTSSIGPDGQPVPDFFIADQLHPSRKAYQVRAPIIRPFVE